MIFWEKNFENTSFDGAVLKSLMKNNFLFDTSFTTFSAFSIKAFLNYVCNSYSKKDSLRLEK